jgi:hypothetical protein
MLSCTCATNQLARMLYAACRACAHSKVEVWAFFIKFIMAASSTLIMHYKWLSAIEAGAALWLLYLYLR